MKSQCRQRMWTLAYYRFDQTNDGLVRAEDLESCGGMRSRGSIRGWWAVDSKQSAVGTR